MQFLQTTENAALDKELDSYESRIKAAEAKIASLQQSAGQASPVTPSQQIIGPYVRTVNGLIGDVALAATGAAVLSQSIQALTINVPFATALPLANGTAAVGTSLKLAREDHVHPASAVSPHPTRAVTAATYTATASDEVIELDTTGNAVTILMPTLPSALRYISAKWTAGAAAATIDGNGANIDGIATFVFASLLDSIGVRQNAAGTGWLLYS